MALQDALNRPPSLAPAAPVGDERPLILVVEDDPALLEVSRSNLIQRGYRIAAAATAAEAVALAHEETPAALVLDINLPDGSGWDVLRALQAEGRRVPTLVVSALRCSRVRLDEFRPDAYLLKPFPLSALLAAVERLAGPVPESKGDHAMARLQESRHLSEPPDRDGANAGTPPAPARFSADGAFPKGSQEPVKYRVPRRHRTHPFEAARSGDRAHHAWPRRLSEPADVSRPTPAEQAACDVVANLASGITRITIAATTPEAVARVKKLAAELGLDAVGADSPSLQRGWVRISRP